MGKKDLHVANSTDVEIRAVLTVNYKRKATHVARQRGFNMGFGVTEPSASFGFNFDRGEAPYEFYKKDISITVSPHNDSVVTLETDRETTVESPNIDVSIEDTEEAYNKPQATSISPGQGIIIIKNMKNKLGIEQAKSKRHFRRFDPWTNRNSVSRCPHKKSKRNVTCSICSY